MIRKPLSIALLGALLFGPAGCYGPGARLPVPQSATDSAAMVRIRMAEHVYVTKHSGNTVEIENLRVEYPRIVGRIPVRLRDVGIDVDSIAGIRTRELNGLKTAFLVVLVSGGILTIIAASMKDWELFEDGRLLSRPLTVRSR